MKSRMGAVVSRTAKKGTVRGDFFGVNRINGFNVAWPKKVSLVG